MSLKTPGLWCHLKVVVCFTIIEINLKTSKKIWVCSAKHYLYGLFVHGTPQNRLSSNHFDFSYETWCKMPLWSIANFWSKHMCHGQYGIGHLFGYGTQASKNTWPRVHTIVLGVLGNICWIMYPPLGLTEKRVPHIPMDYHHLPTLNMAICGYSPFFRHGKGCV